MNEPIKAVVADIVKDFFKPNPDAEPELPTTDPIQPDQDQQAGTRRTSSDKSLLGKNKVDLRTKKGKATQRALITLHKQIDHQKLKEKYNNLPPNIKLKYPDADSYIQHKAKSDKTVWRRVKSLIAKKRKQSR